MSVRELDLLQYRLHRWGRETFAERADLLGPILTHLQREVGELVADPGPEEAADVFLLLMRVASIQGFSLIDAALEKFEVLKRREWGEPDAEGVIEHIRPP